METQSSNLDRISTLPKNINENILSLMPIRDALRTSILSKKWQYSWRNMPKLEFTDFMVESSSDCGCGQLKKYKLVNAIFHVLMLHNGPTILKFNCSVGQLNMDSEFDQIISYLSRGNKLKQLIFVNDKLLYKLPVSFYSLQGLEFIKLINCTFKPPLTFNGFSRLKSVSFINVKVSAEILQRFLSKCPLLELISLKRDDLEDIDFVTGGNKFTFIDLLQCVPCIHTLYISKYYMKYLSADGMPHKLPTSPIHLKHLVLDVCMTDQNQVSSALCLIRSSQLLVKIIFWMYDDKKLRVEENFTNLFDRDDYSDLKLNHLETVEIHMLNFLPLAIDFMKLIMANSPVLKKVQINIFSLVSIDDEVKMLRDLVLLSFPRASPSAKLIIKRISIMGIYEMQCACPITGKFRD